ncbi:sugar ABC transporter substrate-binding protein [Streptomyces sp. NPDC002078]
MPCRRQRVTSRTRYVVGALVAGLLTMPSAACTGGGKPTTDSFTVGLLLPSREAPRWENSDKPLIEQRVKRLCPHCTVAYANAGGDSTAQRQEMTAMITKGVRVLVLGATDNRVQRSSVQEAHNAGVPVVAYDRLADGPISGYVSFDGVQVGRLQGLALLKAMRAAPAKERTIVMMNGDPTSSNAASFKSGALSVLRGKVRIGRAYDTPGWSTNTANANMSAAISALGPGRIDGVLAANDAMAAGVVSALKSARVRRLPPVTGQDADLDGVQRIVKGEQSMTVYKSFRKEAEAAAAMAVALGRGEKLRTIATTTDSPTTHHIPSVLLTPVAVTTANIKQTLVKDGVYTIAQICTPQLRAACAKAGLTP